jgi:hypothetical protein
MIEYIYFYKTVWKTKNLGSTTNINTAIIIPEKIWKTEKKCVWAPENKQTY